MPVVALSVSNRQSVKLILDPFSRNDPAIFYELPLFIYLFAALLIGIVIGGIGSWIAQGRWRQTARERAKEARDWRNTANRVTRQLEAKNQAQLQSASLKS